MLAYRVREDFNDEAHGCNLFLVAAYVVKDIVIGGKELYGVERSVLFKSATGHVASITRNIMTIMYKLSSSTAC